METISFDSRTEDFLRWFQGLSGATFSDAIQIVDLRDRNAGRGVVAVRDIAPETVLFTIPRTALINAQTSELPAKLPQVFHGGQGDDAQLDSWSSLILILVHESLRGDASPWKPYLDVLPAAFDTPMFWSAPELRELQASAAVSKIGKSDAEHMFREKLLPVVRANPGVFAQGSDEELVELAHRMGSTIMAYAFDLENEEEREEDEEDGWVEDMEGRSMMGMVPMADILNADAEFNAHVNHGEDDLTVTALRPIKAGEEILNYYGPHPNSELLRRYGYVTPRHARYDVVEIPWAAVEAATAAQLGLSDSVVAKARESIDEDDFEDTFVLERESGEPTSEGLFSGPATLTELPTDLQAQLKAFLKGVKKTKPELISDKRKRDEVHHLILAKALADLAALYPTSIAQDETLLKEVGEGIGERRRMAVEVRLGEKRLLREASALVAAADGAGEVETAGSKRSRRSD